jgi:hypothetical protein
VSGRLQAETKRVEGPAAVIVTSAKTDLDRETLSRYIVTANDESREQTLAIREHQRKALTPEGRSAAKEIERIFRRHHAYQRLLRSYRVDVPASIRIDFEDDRLTGRREFPKVARLVMAVAFARQMQKEIKQRDGMDCIDVDETDMAIARPLIRKLFVVTFEDLTTPSRNLLLLLSAMRDSAQTQSGVVQFDSKSRFTFTRRRVREQGKWSKTALHRCITELEDYEYVLRDTATRQRPFRYVLDWTPPADSTDVPMKFHQSEPAAKTGD